MTIIHTLTAAALAVALGADVHAGEPTKPAPDATASVSEEDLKAASERIRETGRQLRIDIQQRLREARARRATPQAMPRREDGRDTRTPESAARGARKKAREAAREGEGDAANNAQRDREESRAREQARVKQGEPSAAEASNASVGI